MLTLHSAPPCRHLEPGGWLEIQDQELVAYSDDGTLEPGAPMIRMFDVVRLVKQIERNWGADNHTLVLKDFLKAAGFERIEMRMCRKVPWSPWPRNSNRKKYWGNCNAVSLDTFLHSAHNLLDEGGVAPDDIPVIIDGTRRTLIDQSQHPYSKFCVWTAQKPL